LPQLDNKSAVRECNEYQAEAAKRFFFRAMREYNLDTFAEQYSEYAWLAHDLEMYSMSLEGVRKETNPIQTARHRKTKMAAINTFQNPLKDIKASSACAYIEAPMGNMLQGVNLHIEGESPEVEE
jgi:hypothetical protein